MKLLVVIGTRPEAIKMAPLVAEARRRGCDVKVCATAQHRGLLDQVLDLFGIVPDWDLDLMRENQTLAGLTARAFEALDQVITSSPADWVLVQGDTTTAMVASLAAFYRRIPVGHVEAGLRTYDLERPFPEELNRRVVDVVTQAHFVPTPSARDNLRREAVSDDTLYVTGNTVVDALQGILESEAPKSSLDGMPEIRPGERLVLATAHRRESFGEGMKQIARALRRLVEAHPDVRMVVPVHPNPNVRGVMDELLGAAPRVHLVEPLNYPTFVRTLARSYIVLSDSGGVQEEAPSLGIPALVLREKTERPEAIETGAVKLVGIDEEAIYSAAHELLDNGAARTRMARAVNPYGDGHASERIVSILRGEPWSPFQPVAR